MPTFQDFQDFDLRVGTIIAARRHPTARKPSLQLDIDFGDAGVKQSSAQLTERYSPELLVGRQVAAVLGFPPRRVADYTSEVLVLGAMVSDSDVLLLQPDRPVANGTRIG
jgi:tRNA-binding protein